MLIEADTAVTSRWPGLLDQLHDALDARDDIDRCARIKLASRDTAISVEVSLADGRSAERSVTRREDVVPTFEALLLLPEPSAPASTAALASPESGALPAAPVVPPSEASRPPVRDAAPGAALAAHDASAPAPARSPGRLRIELSVATGARIGDGQASVGLGALSFLEIFGWLVGFEGRFDRYEMLLGGPSAGALELGGLAGRRFRFQNVSLDLDAGLSAVLQGTSTFEAVSPAMGKPVSGSSSSTAPRLLLGARVNFSARSTLHPFIGIDGELGPRRLGDGMGGPDLPGAPRLPIWTLGLALGGTVGTP